MSKEIEVAGFKPGVLVAGADLSAAQYKAVKLDNAGDVVLAGAGELAVGILMNKPILGEAAEIEMDGISKAHMGGTVANAGTKLAADASGRLVAAGSADHVVALSLYGGLALDDRAGVKVIGASGQLLA